MKNQVYTTQIMKLVKLKIYNFLTTYEGFERKLCVCFLNILV